MGDVEEAVTDWLADPDAAARIVHIERIPARPAIHARLDPPLPPELQAALAAAGITDLYRHQVRAITHVRQRRHTVVVAGTASGKSLCYQAPIAEAVLADPAATALALFPTKALAQDQLRAIHRLGVEGLTPVTYDGDTDPSQRAWARTHANLVLTNPDMCHVGILPNHAKWAPFLRRLRFVVVDELHMLRGIFGSHVAHILRRLRRLAAHYGSDPTFVFSSATIGNPSELAAALTGLEVELVDQDDSPAGDRDFVLWNPPLADDGSGRRGSALAESTDVFVDLIRRGVHTIVFARSRKGTELIYRWSRDRLGPETAKRIAAYRGGYLPAERRRIERGLFDGELAGIVTTNALELGIDVGGLDAAVITTYPGTIASLRQQAGRAGRAVEESLAVLVGGEDALDQYFMTHPAELFGRAPEAAVVNPANPDVLAAHTGCAAYELPLVPEDRDYLGEDVEETAARLAADGSLRLRDGKLWWAEHRSPAARVDIRTSGGPTFTIFDTGSGEALGTLDRSRAFSQAHAGAIYLHQGESYVVESLDLVRHEVRVRAEEVGYYTQSKVDQWVEVVDTDEQRTVGRFGVAVGEVEVERHVTGYQMREIRSRSVLGTLPLDLPPERYSTQAVWVTVPDDLIDDAGVGGERLPGTLHAAEHASIGMLPLFAICDRWDVGGLSTPYHPDVGGPMWFIYDGYPGGAGIAPIGYMRAGDLLRATLEAIDRCPCESGCPSCVQSPKCGNFNDPLDKSGAVALLRAGLPE